MEIRFTTKEESKRMQEAEFWHFRGLIGFLHSLGYLMNFLKGVYGKEG